MGVFLKAIVELLRWGANRRPRLRSIPHDVRSLLVVELTNLGDVITIIPALRTLQTRFPAATLSLAINEKYATLLAAAQPSWGIISVRGSGGWGFLSGLLQVRRLHVDLACSLSPARRNAAFLLASGAGVSVGFLTASNMAAPYLGETKVEAFGYELHENITYARERIGERPMKVIRALGILNASADGRISLPPEVEALVLSRMKKAGSIPKGPYVAMNPFSGWEFRTWKLERFADLSARIVQGLGTDVVFVCAEGEASRMKPLMLSFRDNLRIHFFPSHDLLETAVVLKGAVVFVGNDSGPLHLAASLGVNVVGLYGPAPPALTGPRRVDGSFVYKRVECSPCDQRRCVRPDDRCMDLIAVEEVFEAVAKRFTAAHAGRVTAHA